MNKRYLATNFFGFGTGETPWEALSNLPDLNMNGDEPKRRSKKFAETTKGVSLWYIPESSTVEEWTSEGPRDKRDKIAGVLLYGSGATQFHTDALNVAWGEYLKVLD